jgi:hypothetical protein
MNIEPYCNQSMICWDMAFTPPQQIVYSRKSGAGIREYMHERCVSVWEGAEEATTLATTPLAYSNMICAVCEGRFTAEFHPRGYTPGSTEHEHFL